MKKQKLFFLLVLFFLAGNLLYSATNQHSKGNAKGCVVDKQSRPVYSVIVAIEGTNIGDNTDENGEFHLKGIKLGEHTIMISGVGIATKKIKAIIRSNETIDLGKITIDNTITLEEVAVVGKSEARRQQEQAYAITVLDIKKAYNMTAPLNKILNNVSSVRVREDGGTGSNFNFSLNGFSGNQIKFFLDGIPMDNFGSSFNLGNISANMAERIEVYKGVLPISLGGDALGGAVNIVSRKDANYLDASYSIGSYNTHKASINGSYTNLKTGHTIRANTFFNYSDNNYKVFVPIKDLNTNKVTSEQWVKRFHDNYVSGGLKLETGVTNKSYADYLLAGIILSANDKEIQTGATMDAVYGGVKAKSQSLIPSIRYKKENLWMDGLSLSVYGAYSIVNAFNVDTLNQRYNWLGESIKHTTKGENINTDSKIRNKEWLGNINLSYMIDNHQSITLNHSFSSMNRTIFDKVDPENESNKIPQNLTKNITGLGWMIKYDRWNGNFFGKMYNTNSSSYKRLDEFTQNARLEKVEDDKTSFGYGAALTYFVLPKLQFKSSYEQAYRLPESTEMFGDGLIQQRNPDLKPESSHNVNLGFVYEKEIGQHDFLIESNFIYRNTKDFILKGVSLTTNPTTAYENIGKVVTKGIEGGLKYKWRKLIHAGVSVTYQDIIDNQQFEDNNASYVGSGVIEHIRYKERLPNIPYFFGNADFGFNFHDIAGKKNSTLMLDYAFNYVREYYLSFPGLGAKASKKTIPEQISHDVSIGYSVEKGKYNVVLECTNMTNNRLYDNYRLQKLGRTFNLKLRYFLK